MVEPLDSARFYIILNSELNYSVCCDGVLNKFSWPGSRPDESICMQVKQTSFIFPLQQETFFLSDTF